MLNQEIYEQDAASLAKQLLGCELVRDTSEGITSGLIVETEAYHQNDPASHSFKGLTKRNAVMFGPAGHAYVYFTYGMHYCFNVVGGADGEAEAVLIRALQPTRGLDLMKARRGLTGEFNLCSGPAKLTQALAIKPQHNGQSLLSSGLFIKPRQVEVEIRTSPRIGISRATQELLRFYLANSPYITKHQFNRQGILG